MEKASPTAQKGSFFSDNIAVSWGIGVLGLLLLYFYMATPLSLKGQVFLGGLSFAFLVLVYVVRKAGTRFLLAGITLAVSGRYLFWRITETLQFSSTADAVLGYGMFAAELFFWSILVISFLQTLWPRDRRPVPLPKDINNWPSVDVFIPTYNEPLNVVRATTLAAQRMDYPAAKMNIFILDDGARENFRDFAEDAGVGYIARTDNKHAKAGNLNNALMQTHGDLVAIFDCDHSPTRGFLQFTLGWFLADPKMAMLQTPHHFYNQDPFERNLRSGDKVPNEGLLFYGLVQNGNDFWNASFFCGSCAILRRTALEAVGGIAVETVTEDAHTSLRMHQRGWNTGFIRMPLAGGLATGSLGDHVRQRLRWGRGMIQIFRLDNPFLIPGLSLSQRICYASAMLHFLFPLPRLVLLTAPLAYLLVGANIFSANALTVLAYVIPYIACAVLTSMRIHGKHRFIFWTEVYETTLAFHLLRPTIETIFRPRKGKFNVTSKETQKDTVTFDWRITLPQLATVALLIGAIAYALVRYYDAPAGTFDVITLSANIFWASVSIIIISLAAAVGLENLEVRNQARVDAKIPGSIQLESGHAFPIVTENISMGGLSFATNAAIDEHIREKSNMVFIKLPCGTDEIVVTGQVLAGEDDKYRIRFHEQSVDVQAKLAQTIFGRGNAWVNWDNNASQSTLKASLSLIVDSLLGFANWFWRKLYGQTISLHSGPSRAAKAPATKKRSRKKLKPLAASLAAAMGVAAASLFQPAPATAQTSEATAEDVFDGNTRTLKMPFHAIGVVDTIRLQGNDSSRGFSFTIRSDEVVASARLRLRLAFSPNLDPQDSQLSVAINGETVHSRVLNPQGTTTDLIEFPVPPYVFFPDNNLVFTVLAKKLGERERAASTDTSVWVQISRSSELILSVAKKPITADLNNLPAPFFDRRDQSTLSLPFVFSNITGKTRVKAASIVASYWGGLASYRGADFPVLIDALPNENAVVFLAGGETVEGLETTPVSGPTLSVVKNPRSTFGQLLLIQGRNEQDLITAAKALSKSASLLSGASAEVKPPLTATREAYDAPAWLSSNNPTTFGEISSQTSLEGRGLSPGILTVNFRTSPDLFVWGDEGVPLRLNFRYPGEEMINLERSRLDVLINDRFLKGLPLSDNGRTLPDQILGTDFTQNSAEIAIPPFLINGQNQLQFFFDLHPNTSAANLDQLPSELRVSIDSDSAIDMSRAHRFARMPNLAFLAQAGFPFTRLADLSETAVIMPDRYGAEELRALFRVMGVLGDRSGYPAFGVEIGSARDVDSYSDRDIIILGGFDNQPLFRKWADIAPVGVSGGRIKVDAASPIERIGDQASQFFETGVQRDEVDLSADAVSAMMTSYESPLAKGRTIVALMASDAQGLVDIAQAFGSADGGPFFQGDFVTLSGSEILSFRVADPYHVGSLPPHTFARWYLTQRPWLMPIVMVLGVVLFTASIFFALRRRARRQFEAFQASLRTVAAE
ncbi:MAG: UDP-forming cellulose synthase catalytic subunit [Pseudomonadota bacterium]